MLYKGLGSATEGENQAASLRVWDAANDGKCKSEHQDRKSETLAQMYTGRS